MTDAGRKVLAVMEPDVWYSVFKLALASRICQKVTRATMLGATAAGITEARTGADGKPEFRLDPSYVPDP